MNSSSTNKKKNKRSLDLLPSYFRTEKNSKFLSSTLDQIISEPKIKRLDGYVGSRSAVNYNPKTDYYIEKNSSLRSKYQLDPGLVIKNQDASVKKLFTIDDYINQLSINGVDVNSLNKIVSPEIYSYNPPISWDKFINFSEYYWLFNGPQSVLVEDVSGQTTVSTYTVTDSEQGNSFIFTPDGLTPNPVLTLYKGNTYVFNVSSSSKLYIKNSNSSGINDLYEFGITGNGTEQIIFTVPDNAPKNLYYRSDTNQFANGKILIKRRSEKKSINVEEEILGKKSYTSGNGVKFINGLKVKFLDNVLPKFYRNKEFYVEGVGKKIELISVADLQTPELPQPKIVADVNVSLEIIDQQFYNDLVNGMRVRFVGNVVPSFYKDKEFFVDGVGTSISLIPADATPAPVADLIQSKFDGNNFDEFPFDAFKNIPVVPEYITINRASKDLNPWSRYNRWFHRSVIEFSQQFNNVPINLDSSLKAARPIIEFNKNLQLHNFGEKFIGNVTLLDDQNVDAFSTVEGAEEYYIDGIKLEEGHTVIFTEDSDPLVRSKIYRVSFAFTDTNTRRINLTPYEIIPTNKSTVIINKGYSQAGTQWWFDGNDWIISQTRTTRNQSPLFDLYDDNKQSFSNNQLDTFLGNKIFGYKIGNGVVDPVLGFPLSYSSLTVSGTYEFQNFFVTDNFYKSLSTTPQLIDTYKLFYKINEEPVIYKNVWSSLQSFQIPVIQESFVENSDKIEINSVVSPKDLSADEIKVYINEQLISDYEILLENNKRFIKLSQAYTGIVKFKIKTFQKITETGFFETPINLTNNPYNSLIPNFTYTELFDHVYTMIENSKDFQGSYPGVSNLDEIADIGNFGNRIILNSTPLLFAQHFLTDPDNNIVNAINLAADNYNQIKSAIIKESITIKDNVLARDALDQILIKFSENKNVSFPYANSDMIAYGANCKIKNIAVTDPINKYYPLSEFFSINENTNRSVLVYVNDQLLTYGIDYVFDSIEPYVIILKDLSRNDSILIKEYNSTYGSYIAPTPSKLGLYPKYEPKIYIEDTFASGSVELLQGHDGSITKTFGDYRDQILLEFEKRIFNNIKVEYNSEIVDITKIQPGYFRNNFFSFNEVNDIIYSNFIKWSDTYVLDFESNSTFIDTNSKTYNYTSTVPHLPGNWKGIFRYYFDTIRPHTHPWEMLGFTIKPDWWETRYGPSPYTSNNSILWGDLEQGYIAQGSRQGKDTRYARPGLAAVLPVDEDGNLVNVGEWVSKLNNSILSNIDKKWKFGDYGPVEESWRRSSHWPFIVQKLMSLLDSTRYLAYSANFGKIVKNLAGQYIYQNEKYISTKNIVDQLSSTETLNGYLEYVLEYGKIKSKNYQAELNDELKFSDVNLLYKVGGFISKDKTQVIIDSVSPNTINPGALLPQEDFIIELSSFNPVEVISISGVIIRKTENDFVISGYDKVNPYFSIFKPIYLPNDPVLSVGGKSESYLIWSADSYYSQGQLVNYENNFYRVIVSHFSKIFESKNFRKLVGLPTVGGARVQKAIRFENMVTKIPYGAKFKTIQEIYDVIIGYSRWLEKQGFVFDSYNSELQQVIDWTFTAREFLYWSTQNWAPGTAISISPFADKLKFFKENFYVNNLVDPRYSYSILGIDGKNLSTDYFSVSREEGQCEITSNNDSQGIFFAKFYLVQKEHVLRLNNISIFNDVVYDIETGYKQKRIKLLGFKTDEWNGDYFSPGFMYDSVTVKNWSTYTDYKIGDVVKYSNNFYSALKNIAGSKQFNSEEWSYLPNIPEKDLLPNFDYKIIQFEDFYSLDIDNIDISQQNLAQGLIGFNSRNYLSNLILNNVSRYKFYQGYIKEKGTKNALDKISKININSYQGNIEFNEEWAFRSGVYGGYNSLREIEFPLRELDFKENNQIILLNNVNPISTDTNYSYIEKSQLALYSEDFDLDNIFSTKSYDRQGLDFSYPVAGYVRLDDVAATAIERSELVNITNNELIVDGDKIWVCFTDNRDWDIYRYSRSGITAISAILDVDNNSIIIETNKNHNFSVNDIISIIDFNSDINGVHIIKEIPQLNQVKISTTLEDMSNDFTASEIFTFNSFRFNTFDDLAAFKNQNKINDNELVWVDNQDNLWQVFKKINNIDSVSTLTGSISVINQNFGSTVKSFTNTNYIFVAASEYNDFSNDIGRVFIREKIENSINVVTSIGINKIANSYTNYSGRTLFGQSIEFDSTNNIVFVGAPLVGNIKADVSGSVRYARPENAVISSTAAGLVKISGLNQSFTPAREIEKAVLVSQLPQNNAEFGYSIFLTQDISPNKLFVGAPGQDSTGSVFVYNYSLDNTGTVILTDSQIISNPGVDNRFGSKITGSLDGEYLAISSPGNYDNLGSVFIYKNNGTSYALIQSILSTSSYVSNYISQGSFFAEDIHMSGNGEYLFISGSKIVDHDRGYGKVFVYKKSSATQFTFVQTLDNFEGEQLEFGYRISSNYQGDVLLVSAKGSNLYTDVIFDNNDLIFDSGATTFGTYYQHAGSAYLFNRYAEKFVYVKELFDSFVSDNSNYGESVSIGPSHFIVGSPNNLISNFPKGLACVFSADTYGLYSWISFRRQEDLIDLSKINTAKLIDTDADQVINYIEILDPLKGKIAGIADQEIKYKTIYDPAIYNVGNNLVSVDINNNWLDNQVGQLWWDLSSTKFLWYEQGELDYRKNTWGNVFPGTTIDIYEWVRSEYRPSQWAELADTNEGLALGISGQPKYPNDDVLALGQYYNPISETYTDVYYFWVKNPKLIPNSRNRKISAFEVSQLITNPKNLGIEQVSILDKNAISLTNIKSKLKENRVNFNLIFNKLSNSIEKHSEWILLEQGSPYSQPSSLLVKKLFDSLLGRDKLGNIVPDPSLPERMKYGIEIRPRQSMFKNRILALRNLIDYANSVFSQHPFSILKSFNLLNKQDPLPDPYLGSYDVALSSEILLDQVNVLNYQPAELIANINTNTGIISSITIVNGGSGYGRIVPVEYETVGSIIDENKIPVRWVGPSAVIEGNTSANFKTVVNSTGTIVAVEIVDAGTSYANTSSVSLKVRPFTVMVTSDSSSNGRWSKYIWSNNQWIKILVQKYNTQLYWDYVDWKDSDYNELQPYFITVENIFDLSSVFPNVNDYIRINNAGDGNSIILKKTQSTGTFNQDYDLVFRQNGTIKLNENLWNYEESIFGFDQNAPYDKTLYDQTPDIELENILNSIKSELFTEEFKIYWNEFFFAAVKYALSEQKFIDWAFKTSFISVKNYAGSLEQRKVYKLQNSSYLENYVEEIKPYKTKIREFITEYDVLESSNTYNSDFDYPAIYNREENSFDVLDENDINNRYPWQSWKDNHTYSIEKIEILYQGAGYRLSPEIEIIPAADDNIIRPAKARAFISSGKIYSVEILDKGEGYTKTPTIVIKGGGSANISHATLYPVLYNGKIRSNTIKIKFDRISKEKIIGNKKVTDTFITNGNIRTFYLSWAADADDIKVYFNNIKLLPTEYTVENYRKEYIDSIQQGKPYNKLYSKLTVNDNILPITTASIVADTTSPINPGDSIIYLNKTTGIFPGQRISFDGVGIGSTVVTEVSTVGFRPVVMVNPKINSFISKGTRLSFISTATGLYNEVSIQYNKNIELYSAADRIIDYYNPNSGMPGVDLDQLMTGISFPGTELKTLGFNYSSNWDQLPFDSVFWEDTDNSKKLDTIIDGGNLSYSTAMGINPEDIIVSGDAFLSPAHGHAPEELLAGEIHDSLGINVYTRNLYGGGYVINQIFDVVASATSSSYQLRQSPTSIGGLYVSYNGVVQRYEEDFTVDFENKLIYLEPKSQSGRLFVSVIGVGGLEYLSNDYVTVSNTSTASVISGSIYTDIGSTYVTVNGVSISTATTSTEYYSLGPASSTNKRGAVTVFNLPNGTNTVAAWFFRSENQKFTEINEQIITIGDVVIDNEAGYALIYPPNNLGSQSSQAIVEIETMGNVYKRLVPPNTTYYKVTNNQREFKIDPNGNYPANIFDLTRLEVFRNGLKLTQAIDYALDSINDQLIFDQGFLSNGDDLAITILIDQDYMIINNQLYVNFNRLLTSMPIFEGMKIRVITFSNQEYNSMRQEVFDMNEHGFYQLSRQVINDNYVWVSVDRKILINGSDFYIQSGNIVKLDSNIPYVPGSQVVVTSFGNIRTNTIIAYRIFKDMLGRHNFKRLSDAFTTFLTQDLKINDLEIYVNNASVLSNPDPENAVPGVILIGGERIEYMGRENNKLTRITRATLGTGAKDLYKAGTRVFDQGTRQTVPFTENVEIKSFTSTNTTTYIINNINFNLGVPAHDQVDVYFGGRLLLKPVLDSTLRLKHDTTSSYDSGENRSYIEIEPEFTLTAINTNSTAILELTINYLEENKNITIIKRNSTHWYESGINVPTNGKSLLDARTIQAEFLRSHTATLPDKYYYGN